MKKNRETLKSIKSWVDKEDLKTTLYNYGVHQQYLAPLDLPIGDEVIYSDLLSYLSGTYFQNPNYLEIGVSVGKNFLQIANSEVNFGEVFGFEIEKINPILAQQMEFVSKKVWIEEGRSGAVSGEDSILSEYRTKNGSPFYYLSADLWDEANWAKMKGHKFNVIFSDADHRPKAILHEMEMLRKYDLLADKFVMVWDDIRVWNDFKGDMENAFRLIHKQNKEGLNRVH